MATNQETLTELYKSIAVMEMMEKMKACGVVWNKIAPHQFRTEWQQGSDYWDIFLTKMPNGSTITMDFVKNLQHYYSVVSDKVGNLHAMYEELIDNDEYEKDKELMRAVQQIEGC